jgi:hypothetical protein
LDALRKSSKKSNEIISSSKNKQQTHSIGHRATSNVTHIRRELFDKSEADELQNILESLGKQPKLRTRTKLTDVQVIFGLTLFIN